MTDSLADRMKHWRSGEPLVRTRRAWLVYISRKIVEDHAAKHAPRLTVVPLAGDRIAR